VINGVAARPMTSQADLLPAGESSTSRPESGRLSLSLFPRVAFLATLFALELIAICFRFDGDLAYEDPFRHIGAAVLRGVVAFAVLLATIGYAKAKIPLQRISARCLGTPVRLRLLLAHFCAMGAFAFLSASLFQHHPPAIQTTLLASVWFATGVLAIALAAIAFALPALWSEAFRATGNVWIYALFAGASASLLGIASQLLWQPATRVTFHLVRPMLGLFITGVTSDAVARTIGTPTFMVAIDHRCSGLEGAGLMFVMGSLWLWLFRRDFRFPRALLVIPVGIVLLYLLNALRITALILIGCAGAPEVAVHGFHSQAGWIAFNGVAVCLLTAAPRVRWLLTEGSSASIPLSRSRSGDPNSAYLMPLLTILVVAMLSRAASGQFEWLYPLRFFVAAAILWRYRSEYRRLNWRFGWVSLLVGGAAFAIWMALDSLLGKQGNDTVIGPTLAAATPSLRVFWIAIRTLAAVITVPIAEELAFRGFLLRRIVSPDFLSVPPQSVTFLAILVSSIVFGLLHGDRWLAGAIAGLLYALVYLRRGRIGDAVFAHVTTNALLAGYVILWGQWSLW
jgi:exosortase E/protease (VPEID-CTERM system)